MSIKMIKLWNRVRVRACVRKELHLGGRRIKWEEGNNLGQKMEGEQC